MGTPRILEAVILDSVAALSADITVNSSKQMNITGQVNKIDLRSLDPASGLTYTAYAAGTNKDTTITILLAELSKYYNFTITKSPVVSSAITTQSKKYFESEHYSVYSGDSGTATTNVMAALATKVTATITAGTSPFDGCTASTNTCAFTAADANFDYTITCSESGSTVGTNLITTTTIDVALVKASGTTAVANLILNPFGKSATTTKLYATYQWTFLRAVDGVQGIAGTEKSELVTVYWFVDKDDADWATFHATASGLSPQIVNYGALVKHQSSAAIPITATVTAAQLATGYLTSTSAAAVTMTLPTATLLATALGANAGDVFDFVVDNSAGANTVTVAVGSGITASDFPGTNTLTRTASTTVGVAVFRIVFISTVAAILVRIG